jgi:hypothetical protein
MNEFICCIKSKIKRSNEGPDKVGACSRQQRQLHITDLKSEVLALIFENCSHDILARRVRLVCRRFRDVATLDLYRELLTLSSKIDRAMVDAVSRLEESRTLGELLVKTHHFSSAIFYCASYRTRSTN